MTRRRPLAAFGAALALVFALHATDAFAGRSCQAKPPSAATVTQAMALAERTADALDRSGAQVVVIGRAGQDLTAYGIRWSHLAFAYRASPGEPWRLVHKLNQCRTAEGSLYRQGLADFFLDDLWRYEAGIVVLAPEVQAHLLAALADNARVAALDTPAYNMVAYPWSTRYQQSNQWAIETLAMAEDDAAGTRPSPDSAAATRPMAQAWLRLHGYRPAVLHIGAFERLGARITSANVAFDDHPNEQRFAGRIETVTVDSVFEWLARSGLGRPVVVIR